MKQSVCKTTIGSIQSRWIGSDWIGLDWIGLDWIGLDWIVCDGGPPQYEPRHSYLTVCFLLLAWVCC
jgi:hypothetical protein